MAEEIKKEYINAEDLQRMFRAATNQLLSKRDKINALNVFPVPDGDTGTNMYLTMKSAIDELAAVDHLSITKVCSAVSLGALMGARGNSGVILSQILRGVTRYLAQKEKINTTEFAKALQEGVQAAYKAVMRPTEGTILTVVKEAAKEASAQARSYRDFSGFLAVVIKKAEEALEKTPEQLPVLKQAGVVDAGGAGLVAILHGFHQVINGEGVGDVLDEQNTEIPKTMNVAQAVLTDSAEIEFAYCTEMIVLGENLNEDILLQKLIPLGDSLLVVGDSNILKVHVHTNHPGRALEAALEMGNLSKIKIENMREQHHHLIMESLPVEEETIHEAAVAFENTMQENPIAIVGIVAGSGLADIFKSLGTDIVIEGGQTMNPSTEDIVRAVEQAPSQTVFILPNNKNIIMAAQQAKFISSKQIYVIPTTTIPQGIAALLAFNPELQNHEALANTMEAASQDIVTGQLTYSIRDTIVEDQSIHEGDYIALCDGHIAAVSPDREIALNQLLDKILEEPHEIVTIYYGQEVSEEEAQAYLEKAQTKYPNHEIELYYGGQPVYYYIISAE